MEWFRAHAPIRKKLLLAFGGMIGMMVLLAVVPWFARGAMLLAVDGGIIAVAALVAWQLRAAIADPYVDTVVRMEALAAGDLASPVTRTDYSDCVGRLSRAMLSFRDAAVEKQRLATEQDQLVTLLGSGLARVREGDLTATIDQAVPAAYAMLRDDYNRALESLRSLIGALSSGANAITDGATEIAQASEDLARRTETTAASLEETTAAISQMDERLKRTASAATNTVTRADAAMQTVSSGRAIADSAVGAMGVVAESAKGIDDVIEGLDKIAFQTRVLAMNAAVEAGRAGEAGRGFAVVADLVSALAMRAEEEAGCARNQLTATQTEIHNAVELVRKVDGALLAISSDVGEVHDLLGRIADDNGAQAGAIGEITATVGAMDRSTQQNAAMVEETSAAARNLVSEVGELSAAAGRFQIGARATRTTVSAPRPAAKAPVARPSAAVRAIPAADIAYSAPAVAAAGADDWATF